MFSKDGKVRAPPTAFCVTNRYQPLPARVAHPQEIPGVDAGHDAAEQARALADWSHCTFRDLGAVIAGADA